MINEPEHRSSFKDRIGLFWGDAMNAIRIKQVAKKIGLGESTIYRMIADGRFPRPFEIAPKRNAWIEEDIDEWLAEKAGKPCHALRDQDRAMQPSAAA